MKLSEPAENLWRTHRDTLHRIADDIAGPSRLLLGGGTILNADWGHRESIDIDVILPERRNVTDLHPGRRLDLAKARRDPRDLLNRPMTFSSLWQKSIDGVDLSRRSGVDLTAWQWARSRRRDSRRRCG